MSQQTFSNHFKFILSIGKKKKRFPSSCFSIHCANNKYIYTAELLCHATIVPNLTAWGMTNEKKNAHIATRHEQKNKPPLQIKQKKQTKSKK